MNEAEIVVWYRDGQRALARLVDRREFNEVVTRANEQGHWWQLNYFPDADPFDVCAYSVFEQTERGIWYFWDLAGPDGAAFILFEPESATAADRVADKRFLRRNRDVVHLRVLTVAWLN